MYVYALHVYAVQIFKVLKWKSPSRIKHPVSVRAPVSSESQRSACISHMCRRPHSSSCWESASSAVLAWISVSQFPHPESHTVLPLFYCCVPRAQHSRRMPLSPWHLCGDERSRPVVLSVLTSELSVLVFFLSPCHCFCLLTCVYDVNVPRMIR